MMDFSMLVDMQLEAELRGFATRWSSTAALETQVDKTTILVMPLLREERLGTLRAYRCWVLFSALGEDAVGGVTTFDIAPAAYSSLQRLDREPVVRVALVQLFTLVGGGTKVISKK